MIQIEDLRRWHEGVSQFLQREFPGLRIITKNQVSKEFLRWEFETIFWPPHKKPGAIAGYFTLKQLEQNQDVVLETMGLYPHHLKRAIREYLETNISNR